MHTRSTFCHKLHLAPARTLRVRPVPALLDVAKKRTRQFQCRAVNNNYNIFLYTKKLEMQRRLFLFKRLLEIRVLQKRYVYSNESVFSNAIEKALM